MKKRIPINYFHGTASHVFWKEGPLLFDLAHIVPTLAPYASTGVSFRESKLPRLFHYKRKSTPTHTK